MDLAHDILRERILPKPRRGRRAESARGRMAADDARLAIRRAGAEDTRLIESWIVRDGSFDEWAWLGGETSDLRRELIGWIAAPHGAYMLEAAQGPEEALFPVAFANIDDFEDVRASSDRLSLEIGRLVVSPVHRRSGFGSTLVRHLSRVAGEQKTVRTVTCRARKDNAAGQAMFHKLPFVPLAEPPSPRHDPNCVYLRYQLTRSATRVAERVARLRHERKLTQAQAGFLIGVAPSMINMIETDQRSPSVDTLRAIALTLAEGDERVHLALAAVGLELPHEKALALESAREKQVETSATSQQATYWILSDELLEESDPEVFERTCNALRAGKNRWFFVPPGYWEEHGNLVVTRFRSAGVTDETLQSHLRFYKAPGAICALRIAIRIEEDPLATLSALGHVEGSIGGAQGARFLLDKDRLEALLRSLQKAVLALDSISKLPQRESEIDGFKLLFPPAGNLTADQQ
jgi:transcriptional regulator with XRE-family HTH domain/ribosomal protein S18 acetylase RimI-like enzyme